MPLPLALSLFYSHDSQEHLSGVLENTCFYERVPIHDANDFYNYKVSILKNDPLAVLLIVLQDVHVKSRTSHPILASSQCSVQSAQTIFDKYTAVIPVSPGRAFETRIFGFSKRSCTASESYLTVDRVDVTSDESNIRLNDYVPIVIIQNFPSQYLPEAYVDGHLTFYEDYLDGAIYDYYYGLSLDPNLDPNDINAGKFVNIIVRDLPNGQGRCTLLSGEKLFKEPPLPARFEPYTADDVISKADLQRTVDTLKVGGLIKSFQIDYNNIDKLFARKLIKAPAQLQVASYLRGFLPSRYLGKSMVSVSPYVVGLSLLLACSKDDSDMCVSVLMELIHYSVASGAISYEDSAPVPSSEPIWGFPGQFSSDTTFLYDNSRPVADNAWLGICVCRTVRFLQDRLPLGDYKLNGTYPNLVGHLKAMLKSIAYLCAYSISPSSGWCAERLDADTYNYSTFSLSASFLASIFFSEYLEIDYDFFVHSQAANLYTSISGSPIDPRDNFYQFFVYGNEEVYGSDRPEFEVKLAELYQSLMRASYRCLWESKFGTHVTLLDAVEVYESIRAEYFSEASANPPAEYMQLYLINLLDLRYDLFTRYERIKPDWAYVAPEASDPDYVIYSLPDVIFEDLDYTLLYLRDVGQYLGSENPDLIPISWTHLTKDLFPIFNTPAFDLYADESLVQQADDLQLIRNMWGFGQFWTNVENNRNIHSNIGSVLYAESSPYKDWYLAYHLLRDGLNLARAQGPSLKAWENSSGYTFGMASDFFKRSWLYLHMTRTKDSRLGFLESLSQLFGLDIKVAPSEVKPFNRLTDLLTEQETFRSYDLNLTTIQAPFLTDSDYITIVYKPGKGGLKAREVPGFTYLDISCDEVGITVDSLYPVNFNVTSDPEKDGYFKDGPVLVLPLSKYFPKMTLQVDGTPPDHLSKFIRTSSPAGVLVEVECSTGYVST